LQQLKEKLEEQRAKQNRKCMHPELSTGEKISQNHCQPDQHLASSLNGRNTRASIDHKPNRVGGENREIRLILAKITTIKT